MTRSFFIFFILTLATGIASGQQVTVLDKTTSAPIADVVIYSADNTTSVQTNTLGVASVGEFKEDALLIFQHPSYQKFNIQISSLAALNNRILLDEKVTEYKEVIISANKWEQDAKEVPQEIVAIEAEQIRYNNPQTSADVLKSTGQVFVQKSQMGGGSPMLRGFSANRVLLVVDGVRMNNAIFRSGNLQNVISIDPNTLQSAEVLFGPGSVIYGSDALGGVMDFHTITPEFANEEKLKLGATAMTRYSSANNEKTANANISIGGKKLSFFGSISHSDFDDLKTGSVFDDDYPAFGKRTSYVSRINNNDEIVPNDDESLQKFSGYRAWSIINKLRYRPNDILDLQYSFYHANTSDIPRYDLLIQPSNGSFSNAEWYYGPQKWNMHHFKANLYNTSSIYDEAKIIASYQCFEESRHDRRFGSTSLRNRIEKVDVLTLNIDMDKSLGRNSLYYGIEFTHNDVESDATRQDINNGTIATTSSRYPDGGSDYRSLAAYASYQWRLKEELTLSSGARFSNVALKGRSTDSDAIALGFDKFDINNSAVNGNIGLTYNPSEKTKWSWILSTGFRSPNIDDVGKVFEIDEDDNGIPLIIVPNPDLKPEYTYNAEMGLEQQIAGNIKLSLVGFGTFLTNAIVRGSIDINGNSTAEINGLTSELRAQVNTNEAYIYGWSGNLEATLPYHFFLKSSFTLTRGNDKSNDEPLRHTTPNFGQTSIIYENGNLKSEFYVEYNGNRYRRDIPISEIDDKAYLYATHASDSSKDGSPAWHTFNIRSSYQFGEHLTLTAAVENIADKHYRPYSSGISAPGRNFIISLLGTL